MIGYFVLGGFALFVIGMFTHMAWTGHIKFGRRTLLNRHQDPLGFWIVWTIFAGFTAYAYINFAITTASLPGGPLAR